MFFFQFTKKLALIWFAKVTLTFTRAKTDFKHVQKVTQCFWKFEYLCTFRAQVILLMMRIENALEKFNFPCLHFIITSPKLKDDPPEKNCIENHTFLHRKKSTRNFVVGNGNFPQSVKSYAFFCKESLCFRTAFLRLHSYHLRHDNDQKKFKAFRKIREKNIANFFDLTTSTPHVPHLTWHWLMKNKWRNEWSFFILTCVFINVKIQQIVLIFFPWWHCTYYSSQEIWWWCWLR